MDAGPPVSDGREAA